MGCDLYGASPLVGHKGLCRAKPGTAYGAKDKKPGAVLNQQGLILPDPTTKTSVDKQAWQAFHGEKLTGCDSKSGYYEVAVSGSNGATFDHKSADVVRKFPNMSLDRVSFSAHAGEAGTLCIKADQPSIREGILRTIRGGETWYKPWHWFDGDCPTGLSGQQCDALASSMARLRPPEGRSMVLELVFLFAAFTYFPEKYREWKEKRKGGGGDGPGSGGGGNSVDDIIKAYNQGVVDTSERLSSEAASEFVAALTPATESSPGALTQINGQWYAISDEALNPPLVLALDHPRFQTADALHAIVGSSWRMETSGASASNVQLTKVTATSSANQNALAAVGIMQGHAGLVDFVNAKSGQFSPSDQVAFTIQGSGIKVYAGANARVVGGRVVAAPTISIRMAPVFVAPPMMVPAL